MTPIDQQHWVDEALTVLGSILGGATAFPRAKGVWRDKSQDGRLVFDEPVVIHCYTNEESLEEHAPTLREFLVRMGQDTNQDAVGLVVDRDYLEIEFPRRETRRGKKRS